MDPDRGLLWAQAQPVLEIYLIPIPALIPTLKLLLSVKYTIGVVNALLISIHFAELKDKRHSVMHCKVLLCEQNNVHFPP